MIPEEEVECIRQYLQDYHGTDEVLYMTPMSAEACPGPDQGDASPIPEHDMLRSTSCCLGCLVCFCRPCLRPPKPVQELMRTDLPNMNCISYVITPTQICMLSVENGTCSAIFEVPLKNIINITCEKKTFVFSKSKLSAVILDSGAMQTYSLGVEQRIAKMTNPVLAPDPDEFMKVAKRAMNAALSGQPLRGTAAPPDSQQTQLRVFVAVAGTDAYRVFVIMNRDWDAFRKEVADAFGFEPRSFELASIGAAVSDSRTLRDDDRLLVR